MQPSPGSGGPAHSNLAPALHPTRTATGSDFRVILVFAFLILLGMVEQWSISRGQLGVQYATDFIHVTRHALGVLLGLAAAYTASRISISVLRRITSILLPVSVLAVILTRISFSHSLIAQHNGGFLPFPVQPAQLVPFAALLHLCHSLDSPTPTRYGVKSTIHILVTVLAPTVLLLFFDAPGLAVAYCLSALLLVLSAGLNIRHILLAFGFVLLFLSIPIVASPHRRAYLMQSIIAASAVSPNSPASVHLAYQQEQSLMALGAGGPWGVGFSLGMAKHYYLPDIAGTFVMANVGEEFGFIGTCLILAAYAFLCLRAFRITQVAASRYDRLLTVALCSHLVMAAVLNAGVCLALLPAMSTYMPLVSYGRTAQVVTCLSIGLILGVSRRSHFYETPYISLSTRTRQWISMACLWLQNALVRVESSLIMRILSPLAIFLTVIVSAIQVWLWLIGR